MAMQQFDEICLPIQQDIEQVEHVLSENITSRVPFVEKVVEYVIQNGGKRLRPILTILSAKLSGYQGSAAVQIGAALEFMHTASLLHDDVLDNAELRRGRSSTNKKWGNHVSVLVGDFFYCRAMDILVKHGDLKVLRAVTDAITITTEGEIFEITKSNDLNLTQDAYLEIITAKTAALMAAACQAGAILGKVADDLEFSLKKFGLNLGIAFQLMDDVLDYTSSPEDFGKKKGTDLREGKLTLPVILALKRCEEREAQKIKTVLLSEELEPGQLELVIQLIERYDGIADTIKLAKSYLNHAQENLAQFRPSLEKETLSAIADYVLVRNH